MVEGVAMTGGEELDDESLADAEAEGYKVAVEECKRCGLDGFWGGVGTWVVAEISKFGRGLSW